MPLNNFGLVAVYAPHDPLDSRSELPKLWRSAQPERAGFNTLVALGVGLVVKLNTDGEYPDDVEMQAISPASLMKVPLNALNPGKDETMGIVKEIVAALESGVSVLVHCTHGRDRTGLIIGAFRLMESAHWGFDAVMKERAVYGAGGFLIELVDAKIDRKSVV